VEAPLEGDAEGSRGGGSAAWHRRRRCFEASFHLLVVLHGSASAVGWRRHCMSAVTSLGGSAARWMYHWEEAVLHLLAALHGCGNVAGWRQHYIVGDAA
jgi:hypothetical protein